MLSISKSIFGISSIEVVENDSTVLKKVAQINANIPEDGEYNINKVIQDRDLFNEHKESVLEDFYHFENYVYKLVNSQEDKNETERK